MKQFDNLAVYGIVSKYVDNQTQEQIAVMLENLLYHFQHAVSDNGGENDDTEEIQNTVNLLENYKTIMIKS